MRGPRINVPEMVGHSTSISLKNQHQVEKWIRKGWIDLRTSNMDCWRNRFRKMLTARAQLEIWDLHLPAYTPSWETLLK